MRSHAALLGVGAIGVVIVAYGLLAGQVGPAATPTITLTPATTPDTGAYLVDDPLPAAPLNLMDQAEAPFQLSSLRGEGVLVFFGYTHCPDVCPETLGVLSQVLDRVGPALRVVFVTVDPERDTPAFLTEYVRYLPPGFTALTGAPGEIRVAADSWGVRYARVDGDSPDAYSMTHTSTVYLVDPAGLLRAEFPFGTGTDAIVDTVRSVLARPIMTTPSASPPTAVPTSLATPTAQPASPGPSAGAALPMRLEVQSTAVWSGGASPVILALSTERGRVNQLDAQVRVSVIDAQGAAIGPPVDARAVQPWGVPDVSYVAPLDIPTPGWWTIRAEVVSATDSTVVGSVATGRVAVRDPGFTARLGAPAPNVHTPTIADDGGDIRRISTDPLPMPKLYETSVSDALAAHEPFVLVLDSSRWKTTDICGTALVMVRYMTERWPDQTFIHLEPFAYDVVTDSLVLRGSLAQPEVVPAAEAWGIATPPWVATSMPWVFVVDGNGIVRAKYQGVVGSADIDVLITMLRAGA
jgi:protein SCO1/2